MKSFDASGMNKIVPIIAFLGLVVMIARVSLLPNQSSNATGVSIGNEQETGDNTNITNIEVLNHVLGSTFLNGTDTLTSFNPINEAFTQISYAGERSIKPPIISDLIINATESGNLSMIHQPVVLLLFMGIASLQPRSTITTT